MDDWLVEVKVWGRYACFTRPETKVERLSYPIIPPSAAAGVLESIYWKPQFRWDVTEIAVLPHPDRGGTADWENYMPITLNELSADGDTHPPDGYNLVDHRVQRTCLVLRWPCYRIRAKPRIFCTTTNRPAIKRQFDDRVSKGKCHQQPCLGLREFTAYFAAPGAADLPAPALTQADLGMITHSVVLPAGAKSPRYRFVRLALANGIFAVPQPDGLQ